MRPALFTPYVICFGVGDAAGTQNMIHMSGIRIPIRSEYKFCSHVTPYWYLAVNYSASLEFVLSIKCNRQHLCRG